MVGDREQLDHVLLGAESPKVFDGTRHRGKAIAALIKGTNAKALRRACDATTALDCYLLGVITFANGGAAPAADTAAAEPYRSACDNGNGWGCFALGDMYVRGFGVARSLSDAEHYCAEVCLKGVGGEANSFVDECRALTDALAVAGPARAADRRKPMERALPRARAVTQPRPVIWMRLLVLPLTLASAISTPNPHRETPCLLWRGTASGNDRSVRLAVTLCEADGRVTGALGWHSDRSGTSTRKLEGTRRGDVLVLRDTSVAGTPNPGWRFCAIDVYRLSGAGTDHLSGSYHSTECRDDANLELDRVR